MIHQLMPYTLWNDIYIHIHSIKKGNSPRMTYFSTIVSLFKYLIDATHIIPSITNKIILVVIATSLLPLLVPYYLFICYKVRSYFHAYPEELI